jgi:hypothetical protein
MEVLLGKMMSSPLLIAQKIDQVKTFLFPSIDFLLLNREAGVKHLQIIDKMTRRMISEKMKIRGLPIECHHAPCRDGGFCSPILEDRDDVLMIGSFAHMTLSEDNPVWTAVRQFIKDKRRHRRIESDPRASFPDWKENGIEGSGTASFIARMKRSCKVLDVELKLEVTFW